MSHVSAQARPPLLVLTGGFGTRLRSVVSDVPKPLAPAGEKPFLHHLINSWTAQGITEFVFLLHYQAEIVEAFLERLERAGELTGCRVRTVTEAEPLGTGGAVAHAVQDLGLTGTVLVTNADTWLGDGAIAAVAAATAPAMAVVEVEDSGRYGGVEMLGDTVTSFSEKREGMGRGWVNAGLYHLDCADFGTWDGKPFSMERSAFPSLVESGRLRAVRLAVDFIDIGVPEDYFRFCRMAAQYT